MNTKICKHQTSLLLMKSSALNLPRQFPRYACGWLVLVSLLFVGLTIARADAVSELASFSIFDKVDLAQLA
ncbi:MAG: hypothetical protein DMF33_10185, partial [Verrucomicrobia bacterium]